MTRLHHYLTYRRYYETLFWGSLLLLLFLSNISVIAIELKRDSSLLPFWEPVVWEGSSLVAVACLLPLVVWFDQRLPLRWSSFPVCTLWHLLFSLGFSLAHVLLMVGMRKIIYTARRRELSFWSLATGVKL